MNVAVDDILPLVLPGGRLADGRDIGEMEFAACYPRACSARRRNSGSAQADGILHLDGGIGPGDDVCAHYSLADTVLERITEPPRLPMHSRRRAQVAAVTGTALRMPDASFSELAEQLNVWQ